MTPWEDTCRALSELRSDVAWREYMDIWAELKGRGFEVDGMPMVFITTSLGKVGIYLTDARDVPIGTLYLSPTRARKLAETLLTRAALVEGSG